MEGMGRREMTDESDPRYAFYRKGGVFSEELDPGYSISPTIGGTEVVDDPPQPRPDDPTHMPDPPPWAVTGINAWFHAPYYRGGLWYFYDPRVGIYKSANDQTVYQSPQQGGDTTGAQATGTPLIEPERTPDGYGGLGELTGGTGPTQPRPGGDAG
jgi:hypothetical protein